MHTTMTQNEIHPELQAAQLRYANARKAVAIASDKERPKAWEKLDLARVALNEAARRYEK